MSRGMQQLEPDWGLCSAHDQGTTAEIQVVPRWCHLDDNLELTGRRKSTRSMDTIQAGNMVDGQTESWKLAHWRELRHSQGDTSARDRTDGGTTVTDMTTLRTAGPIVLAITITALPGWKKADYRRQAGNIH